MRNIESLFFSLFLSLRVCAQCREREREREKDAHMDLSSHFVCNTRVEGRGNENVCLLVIGRSERNKSIFLDSNDVCIWVHLQSTTKVS